MHNNSFTGGAHWKRGIYHPAANSPNLEPCSSLKSASQHFNPPKPTYFNMDSFTQLEVSFPSADQDTLCAHESATSSTSSETTNALNSLSPNDLELVNMEP